MGGQTKPNLSNFRNGRRLVCVQEKLKDGPRTISKLQIEGTTEKLAFAVEEVGWSNRRCLNLA